MKVVFKLTPTQTITAAKIETIIEGLGESNSRFGNLLGDVEHKFNFNPNQSLNFVGDTVIYKGERMPLHKNGGLRVLHEIVMGKASYPDYVDYVGDYQKLQAERNEAVKKLTVIDYQTSDTKLAWYETMQSWVTRASDEELIQELRTTNWGDGRTPVWVEDAADRLKLTLIQPGTTEYRRAMAAGKKELVDLALQLVRKGYAF